MNEKNKCKNCKKEFPKIYESHAFCYQCSVKRTESTINHAKKSLEREKKQLETLATKEESDTKQDLIKKTKENIKKCEQILARTTNTHLEALLLHTTDLTTLEENYR